LEHWYTPREREIEVAEYRVHESAGRQPSTSFCVWREGCVQLLPQTDRICFLRNGQSPDHPLVEGINVGWQRAREVVGEMLLEEEDQYPARYRVEGFPTTHQLERLRQSASAR
jgi:hypothetical protein